MCQLGNVIYFLKYIQEPIKKYHKTIEVREDIDIESAKSNYNNGILEITFKRKQQQKPKGRQINIE